MAAQAVVFQDCRASGVNLKRNLIQTSLGRRQRGFYVLFCVFNVPWEMPKDCWTAELFFFYSIFCIEKNYRWF